ncbi:hypothetical protein TVAG_069940 [Trichomonas vaginalis G3]|uniref:Uncharacterized protein n=1 Tax=Trichomonas vaginalis (strain ATCC PRA-98 / G3) TaxID=412133 RepID=A2ESN5_TRIV3|nr:hypothetical protein TVAGG3_0220770 [Trichomonas vaginalis G3]EAY04344.1 hypothetical protein TVAG_069940 [Trichomonas vaginalis G3]KAI5551917.1 hypothetical protein TVAGG3_0220770 [Trichomonas vaginalis G3]|eukprot:XP_001316567.1 hypothetical protein [Trichomonas vaginalis G3]
MSENNQEQSQDYQPEKPDMYTPEIIKNRLTNLLTPYKEYIDQFQLALYLKNIKLYLIIMGSILSVFLLYVILYFLYIPPTILAIISIPLFQLIFVFDLNNKIKDYFLTEIPETAEDAPDRIRPIAEIVHYAWIPARYVYMFFDISYRAIFTPNKIDTLEFIVSILLLGFINRILNIFVLITVTLVVCLVIPPVLIHTPAGKKIKKFVSEKKKPKTVIPTY